MDAATSNSERTLAIQETQVAAAKTQADAALLSQQNMEIMMKLLERHTQ